MTRREFLGAAASTAVAPSGTANQDAAARPSARLIASAPVLMNAAGVTEDLKARDPMAWVGLMNSCKAQAEEVILQELINN